ncbi:MAG: alpha/beta fold hydrolase, partial [Myxococcota bacterium]|nr:alpha/beta fold hydrolase [Myxococcota bacterium]
VALSPTEIHGVTLGAGAPAKLAARGVRFLAAAAEDDPAPAPAGVRAIEASAGVENVVADVFETGGHGVALLRGRPDLADAALAFATRLLASSERVAIPVGDEIVLIGSLDPALDPSAPAIVLVHGLRRDSRSLEPLRAALATALPYRILAVDLRAHGASIATSSGSPIGFEQLSGGVPDEDVRSYRGLLRDVEAVVRFATNTGDDGTAPARWAIVGAGFGGTLAVVAAGAATADPGVGPPAAIVLLSPVANMHGLSIWESLGARLRPGGVQVFAAASSRASMSLDDAAEGIGSDARTVRTISTMLGPGAPVRIYPSDAYAEDLQAAHRDLVPAIVEFLRRIAVSSQQSARTRHELTADC